MSLPKSDAARLGDNLRPGVPLASGRAADTGVRAPMLAGTIPIAAATMLLTWRHRGVATPRSSCH